MTEIEQVGDGRWEITHNYTNENEDDFDGANNSAKLFERSRIKALAGECKDGIIPQLINEDEEMPAHNCLSVFINLLKVLLVQNCTTFFQMLQTTIMGIQFY